MVPSPKPANTLIFDIVWQYGWTPKIQLWTLQIQVVTPKIHIQTPQIDISGCIQPYIATYIYIYIHI